MLPHLQDIAFNKSFPMLRNGGAITFEGPDPKERAMRETEREWDVRGTRVTGPWDVSYPMWVQ